MRAILVLIVAPSIAFSAPKHRPTPTPTPAPATKPKAELVCRTKQQDLELRDWIGGLMNELHQAQADNAAAKKTNDDAVGLLGMSVKDAAEVIKQCAADKACAQAPFSCWFHRFMRHLFWIAGGLIVVAVLLFFFAPGALKLILSVANFIWSWIAAIFKPKPPTTP